MSIFVTRARIPYSQNTKKPKYQCAMNVRFAIFVNIVISVNLVSLVNIANIAISVSTVNLAITV